MAFAGLTALLAAGHLYAVDLAVSEWAFAHETTALYWIALIGNQLGQSGPILPAFSVVALWLAYRRRDIRPLILVLFTSFFAAVVVAPIKELGGRDAPRSTLLNKVELFNDLARAGYDWSYPSGHMVNTFVWFFTLVMLLEWLFGERARRFEPVLRIAPPVIVFITTVFLNFHWLTDSIAGLLLGVVMGRVMARIPWWTLPLPSWLPLSAQPADARPGFGPVRGGSAGAGGAEAPQPPDQHRVVG